MKRKIGFHLLFICLIIIFLLQFLSQLFFFNGKKQWELSKQANPDIFKTSSRIFPLDASTYLEYASALMINNKNSLNQEILDKSIHFLKKSIAFNLLNFNAYLFLGKAYLIKTDTNPRLFHQGMENIKRAAKIRGSNIPVSMDALRMLLSNWPFVGEADREFAMNLLDKIILRLSEEQFLELLNIWINYSKDVFFLNEPLKSQPKFFLTAAKELGKREIMLKTRQSFLAHYEIFILDDARERYSSYLKNKPAKYDIVSHVNNLLNRRIHGFYILTSNQEFKQKTYYDLKSRITEIILEDDFKKNWKKDDEVRRNILKKLEKIISENESITVLNNLYHFLQKKNLFEINDLQVFLLKQQIEFKRAEYSSIISETESLMKTISYVKEKDQTTYFNILLLVSQSYINSRLLSRAEEILKEAAALNGSHPEIEWLKFQISSIMENDQLETQSSDVVFEAVQKSRFITINSLQQEPVIYLADANEIEISFDPEFMSTLKEQTIFQVYHQNTIYYEVYKKNIKTPLHIKIPIKKRFSKHQLKFAFQ